MESNKCCALAGGSRWRQLIRWRQLVGALSSIIMVDVDGEIVQEVASAARHVASAPLLRLRLQVPRYRAASALHSHNSTLIRIALHHLTLGTRAACLCACRRFVRHPPAVADGGCETAGAALCFPLDSTPH